MERIAVGLSDQASQKALEWVIDRAMTRSVDVTLVAAYDWVLTPRTQVTDLLRAAREKIGGRSPRTVVHLAPIEDDAISALATASRNADLLVIGAHLRGRFAGLTETPALRVARHAHCATVIVPEEWEPAHHGMVITGLDDDSSSSSIEFAVREAERSGAQLEVIRAWTAPMPAYDPLVWVVDTEGELRISNRQRLEAETDRLTAQHPTVRVRSLLAECLPVAALLERAAKADLVVIGTHRHGPLVAMITGSTARGLLKAGSTPLCIVPVEKVVGIPAGTAGLSTAR